MLIALSPAKTLDLSPLPQAVAATRPIFVKDTAELARIAGTLNSADLRRLMGISDKLAALTFAGDVYVGLRARELEGPALDWAQGRLRILSGLYGVLRPLDAIQPYRLEMGIKLPNARGPDLYAFWREKVTKTLAKELKAQADPTLINLASQEYFGVVDRKALKRPVITCTFREEAAGGKTRVIALFAKRARGAMARFAVDHQIERAEDLKGFDRDGYRFAPDSSDETEWTFLRPAR